MKNRVTTAAIALALGLAWSAAPAVAQSTTEKMKDKAESTKEKIEEKATDLKDKIKDKVSRDTPEEKAQKAAEKAERMRFVSRVPMLCECSDPDCRRVVMIGLEDYHAIRRDSVGGHRRSAHLRPQIVLERHRVVVLLVMGTVDERHRTAPGGGLAPPGGRPGTA